MSNKKNMCEIELVPMCKSLYDSGCRYFEEGNHPRKDICLHFNSFENKCECKEAIEEAKEQPKRKPLPDGVLPMTDEEKYELCKMMGYENISEIFYDNKLHFKCFDRGWGIIVDVKAILWLAQRFNLEG